MIELLKQSLVFSFPEAHPLARLTIDFQRTLRIPDDGNNYPLPPGLGKFPLSHVDDHQKRLPQNWLERGGVMLPMYQSEALWINFDSAYDRERGTSYPMAVKIATGKVNAVDGSPFSEGLSQGPQDYLVIPTQPWLDGYRVEKGLVRQFVAMPLGSGYSAEEQLSGRAEYGGLQIKVFPMKAEVFEKRFPKFLEEPEEMRCMAAPPSEALPCCAPDMGLAPGGRMRQEIYNDEFGLDDWDRDQASRCFVHLANSLAWRSITGREPPTAPFTAGEYARRGLPWFEYYDDKASVVPGSAALAGLASVAELAKIKGETVLPDNQPLAPDSLNLQGIRARRTVREGSF